MNRGVEILLVPGTFIPSFVHELEQGRVHTSYETFMTRRVFALRISNAEADFIPGGLVAIRASSADGGGRVAFGRNAVFEIRELPMTEQSVIKRNRNLCVKCVEFSGRDTTISDKYNVMKFTCKRCGETWEA